MSDGKKYDAGKLDWSLVDLDVFNDFVRVLMFGASRYGRNNWRGLADADQRYYAALMRHLVAWRSGQRCDPDSGLPHLAHAICNLFFLSWFELVRESEKPVPANEDRPCA